MKDNVIPAEIGSAVDESNVDAGVGTGVMETNVGKLDVGNSCRVEDMVRNPTTDDEKSWVGIESVTDRIAEVLFSSVPLGDLLTTIELLIVVEVSVDMLAEVVVGSIMKLLDVDSTIGLGVVSSTTEPLVILAVEVSVN